MGGAPANSDQFLLDLALRHSVSKEIKVGLFVLKASWTRLEEMGSQGPV